MERDWQTYLWDVRESADAILRFVANTSLDEYIENEMLQAAVERHFTIIGEALGRLAGLNPEVAIRIPDLRQAVGFRNVLVHAYPLVDPRTVWLITQEDLPLLRRAVQGLLDDLEGRPG